MRFSIKAFLASVAAPLLLHGPLSDAFPTGAPNCLAGPDAPKGPHTGANKGSTEENGYAVAIDGVGEFQFNGATLQIPTGVDHTLSIRGVGSDDTFKGFLIRISRETDGTDLGGSLSNPTDSPDIQIMESTGETIGGFGVIGKCAVGVAGATHTASDSFAAYDKTEVSAGLLVPLDVTGSGPLGVTVEVTIVKAKDEYYYSAWPLVLLSGGATPDNLPEMNDNMPEMNDTMPDNMPEMNDTMPDNMPEMNETMPDNMPEMNDTMTDDMPEMNDTMTDDMPEMNDTMTDDMPEMNDTMTDDMPEMNDTIDAVEERSSSGASTYLGNVAYMATSVLATGGLVALFLA